MGTKIASIKGLEILDSRGNPTLRVTLIADNGCKASASVPSGASTGSFEALELRDNDKKRYHGKGVLKAIANVEGPLAKAIISLSAFDQNKIDQTLIQCDGTENKSKYGANAILGISLAAAKLGACLNKLPLYKYLGGEKANLLPCPMINIINGGAHANNSLDFQEFMIRPIGARNFAEALRMSAEVFFCLKTLLQKKGFSSSVGDEGGFAPNLGSHEEALDLILTAIREAGFQPGKEISLALDCAASEFYDAKNGYLNRSSEEHLKYLNQLCTTYPIDSIEDGMAESDWSGWQALTNKLGNKVQIVGDDLLVTNTQFVQRAIEQKAANAVLIKPNQIGTLTETLECIRLAQTVGWGVILSHRSGETEDTTIADLAVAVGAGQIKTGSVSRGERTAKYNRLLEIESELGSHARYKGS